MNHDPKHLAETLARCDAAIAQTPGDAEAHHRRAAVLFYLRRLDEAAASFDRAIALKPDYPDAHHNRGVALNDLRRFADALPSFDRAIALRPAYAEAFFNRANALYGLDRTEDALTSYAQAIALKPDYADAHHNRAVALGRLRRYEQALKDYDDAIALKPDYAEAIFNRAGALYYIGRLDDAIADYNKAVALRPDHVEAHRNRGVALYRRGRFVEALASYVAALKLKPDYPFLLGDAIYTKMKLCEWRGLTDDLAALRARIARGERVAEPFSFLAMSNELELQKRVAGIWMLAKRPPGELPQPSSTRPGESGRPGSLDSSLRGNERTVTGGGKIRLGYFSANFGEHAMSHLLAEMFEQHDRSRFHVVALSYGADTKDELRQRQVAAFDQFIDVRERADAEIARLARDLELDIAVDLMGYTTDARSGIFALRAAPLQVHYMGYPGTLAADYIDYLIADPVLIPPAQRSGYAEKIVYLPDTYLAHDSRRKVAEHTPTRTAAGLPERAFVFCCFNNNYKITPALFNSWVRILAAVDGSVLWLFQDNATATENLKREAAQRGVDAQRIVFAPRMPAAEHLARHRLADLVLDTLPYNAHTTAADALWMGVPVLTRIGETFAGRVAASLLTAIGLPELITTSLPDYEALAIELATHPNRLAELKSKLARNRLTMPLFDTLRFARNMEAAYAAMIERCRAGLPPDDIRIA